MDISKVKRHPEIQAQLLKPSTEPKRAETVIEQNKNTIEKFVTGGVYDSEDFKAELSHIVEDHKVLDSIDELEYVELKEGEPFFCVVPKYRKTWVMFCLVRTNVKEQAITNVLYKDPCGRGMPELFHKKLVATFRRIEVIENEKNNMDCKYEAGYGPLTLRNLDYCLRCVKNLKVLNLFSKLEFTSENNVKVARAGYLRDMVAEFLKNKKFRVAVRDFVESLPIDLFDKMENCKKIVKEELEKGSEGFDASALRQAEANYESIEQELQKVLKISADKDSKNEPEIVQEFPEQMKKFELMFGVLQALNEDEQFVPLVGRAFMIEEKFKKLYLFKKKERDESEKKEPVEPSSKKDVAEPPPCPDCTNLTGILEGICIGIDSNDPTAPRNQDEIDDLKRKYNMVMKSYDEFKNFSLNDIQEWAKDPKRGYDTDDDVCRLLAIMDRASLLQKNYHFRIPQLLSVLIFLHGNDKKGCLCQIQTGEGKTSIIGMLAVVQCLRGWKVDVITSNAVLATEGATETKDFIELFGKSVSTNNPGEHIKPYEADVVYGCISNFQFDYLKQVADSLVTRGERPFQVVLIDEVDSMLIDNGGQLAKLAAPFPGMECFRYIYIKIWQELIKAVESLQKETLAEMAEIRKKYVQGVLVEQKINEYMAVARKNERVTIAGKMRAEKLIDITFMPHHLEKYAKGQLEIWIRNAISANYDCYENHHYRIVTDKDGGRLVAPVDYLNTGITLKTTIWTNGLHQFIQLKHNLKLTYETLTSSCISNVGYIKKYPDKNIYGMTGTLGCTAEQNLLAHIYQINFAKLPPYTKKKFAEVPGLVFPDESWAANVTLEIMKKIDEKRAILAIFETCNDVLTVERMLDVLQRFDKLTLRMYATEDDFKKEGEDRPKTDIGHVILATNIAGRGTNFKTTKDLENNGGLHVFVCFLPCNMRVESQAFGRTARQGKSGTAQLLIRTSDLDAINMLLLDEDFGNIKKHRDIAESNRLRQIKEFLLKELIFLDSLNDKFFKLLKSVEHLSDDRATSWCICDLKEEWAFWLAKEDFNFENIRSTTPQEKFEEFKANTFAITHKNHIIRNPYYLIGKGADRLRTSDLREARSTLERALSLHGEQDAAIYPGAHMKLFEYHIRTGDPVMQRLQDLIKKVLFIPVLGSPDDKYIQKALAQVKKAEACLHKELNYLEALLQEDNKDFRQILKAEDKDKKNESKNDLISQVLGRHHVLRVHLGVVEAIITKMSSHQTDGILLETNMRIDLKNYLKIAGQDKSEQVKKIVTIEMLSEFRSLYLNKFYSVGIIYHAPREIVTIAQANILGGLALIACGIFFIVFLIKAGISLIVRGIMDIVMLVVTGGKMEPDLKVYYNSLLVDYAQIAAVTVISAIAHATGLVQKVLNYLKKLSDWLKKIEHLRALFSKLANLIDKFIAYIDKAFAAIRAAQKVGSLIEIIKDVVIQIGKQVVKGIIDQIILPAIVGALNDRIVALIKEKIKGQLYETKGLHRKFETNSDDTIAKVAEAFTRTDSCIALTKDAVKKFTGFRGTGVGAIGDMIALAENITELALLGTKLCQHLNNNLSVGTVTNELDSVIDKIVDNVGELIFKLWCAVLQGVSKQIKYAVKIKNVTAKKKYTFDHPYFKVEVDLKSGEIDLKKIFKFNTSLTVESVRENARQLALMLFADEEKKEGKEAQMDEFVNSYKDILRGFKDLVEK